jgi:glycosyltransferase involved in cell wall biosynthesis
MQRGRLLAVAPVSHPGGAETTLLRLLDELARRGWKTELATPASGSLSRAAAEAGHGTVTLPVGGMARRSGAGAVRAWPLTRRLASGQDVVLLNGGVPGRLLPALRGTRARAVLSLHDVVDRVPFFWRWADLILAASAAVAARLRPLGAHVAYPAVDQDPPPARPPWPADGRPTLGFVGRIEPRKAPADLVAAASAIRREVPDARIVLVGDDPYGDDPGYVRRVEREAATAGVERHGWVDNAPGLMRHLDVLVLPSRQEPWGTVLAEAMAVGTPVVATRVGGLAEVVEDGVTGRLVPPASPTQLAAAAVEVWRERERMGAAAAQSARRFSPAAYADRVEELLEAAG